MCCPNWEPHPEEHAMPTDLIAAHELTKWEEASYARMLKHFFNNGKTPDQVTSPEFFAWAHGVGLSGLTPSSVTVCARIGCLSSFYRFLIRMALLQAIPCDALQRPRTQASQQRGTWA